MSSIRNAIKNKVFIIAEIGVNHNGNLKLAKINTRSKIWCRCCKISIF